MFKTITETFQRTINQPTLLPFETGFITIDQKCTGFLDLGRSVGLKPLPWTCTETHWHTEAWLEFLFHIHDYQMNKLSMKTGTVAMETTGDGHRKEGGILSTPPSPVGCPGQKRWMENRRSDGEQWQVLCWRPDRSFLSLHSFIFLWPSLPHTFLSCPFHPFVHLLLLPLSSFSLIFSPSASSHPRRDDK